jgi:hypothetical protein
LQLLARIRSERPMANEKRTTESVLGACEDVPGLKGILRVARPNLLILGTDGETKQTIDAIASSLADPVATWVPSPLSPFPDQPCRTLIIHDVDRLTFSQQEHLVRISAARAGALQIIATSQCPLFTAVQRGVFLERLYYRLNVVVLDLTALKCSSGSSTGRPDIDVV